MNMLIYPIIGDIPINPYGGIDQKSKKVCLPDRVGVHESALFRGLGFYESANPLRDHVIAALTATIVGLFAHCMVMFYFIGSAKMKLVS